MSSLTSQARKAVRAATLSRLLSWLAAAIGIGFVLTFLHQAGLFRALMPQDAVAPPPAVEPDRITAGSSTVSGIDAERRRHRRGRRACYERGGGARAL